MRPSVRNSFYRKPFNTFLKLYSLLGLVSVIKMFHFCLIIFTVLAILAKYWSTLAIWLDVCHSLLKGLKSLKNLKVGVFETDFKKVPFVFRQTTNIF